MKQLPFFPAGSRFSGRTILNNAGFGKLRYRFLVTAGHKRAIRTGWNGTKLLLGLLKEFSDACPPLKSAIGGLLALIDVFERTKSNKADVEGTSQRLDELLRLLAGRLKGDRATIMVFLDSRYVKSLEEHLLKLERMKKEGRLRRIANSTQNEAEIRTVCQEIERALQALQLNIGLAQERLSQEILKEVVFQSLPQASGAAYTAAVPGAVSRTYCTPGTRDDVLAEIMDWALDDRADTPPVYWISGLAGQGKTTVAYTVCKRLVDWEKQRSFISFFCSRQLDTNQEKMLVSTIAFKLAETSSSYAAQLLLALRAEHDLGGQGLDIQMSKLLVGPWIRSAEKRVGLPPVIVVVDALDENEAGTKFIELILAASREEKLPGLRILMTSRPEPGIVEACRPIDNRAVYNLNEIYPYVVQSDIWRYLTTELPNHRDDAYLVDVANVSAGVFLHAATVVRMIKSYPRKTISEEAIILRQVAARAPSTGHGGAMRTIVLYDLYDDIMARAFSTVHPDLKDARERVLLTIICSNFLGYQRDTLSILAFCADVEESLVHAVVEALYPVLYIRDNAVFWHHASFQDHILATYENLIHPTHERVARRCLIVWNTLLGLAKDGKSTVRDEDCLPWLERRVVRYKEKLEQDSSDWPTPDNPNNAPDITWDAFHFHMSFHEVQLDDERHRWRTVSEFLSCLRDDLQDAGRDHTGS